MSNRARILAWPATPADDLPAALWSAEEIAAATGGTASGAFLISNVATDSREIVDGGLFVAMKGEAMDGHRFLDGALGAGRRRRLLNMLSRSRMCWWRIALPRCRPLAGRRGRGSCPRRW